MLKIALICLLLAILLDQTTAAIYAIQFDSQFYYEEFDDVEATFGPKLSEGMVLRAMLSISDPVSGCEKIKPPPNNTDINETGKWVVLMPRFNSQHNCSFEDKIRNGQQAGYNAVVVYNVGSNALVPMSAQNSTGIDIPSVFVSENSGLSLKMFTKPSYFIVITGEAPANIQTQLLIPFAIVVGICFIVMIIFMIVKFIKDRRRQRRHRLPTSTLNKIPTCKYQKGDPYDTCAICLDDYIEGEKLRVLPCNHVYHTKCIDPWLTKNRRVCPICKRKVFAHDEVHHDSDSDSDADDTTPLINSNNRGTQGGTFNNESDPPALSISQWCHLAEGHSVNGVYVSVHNSVSSDDENPFVDSIEGDNPFAESTEEVRVHPEPENRENSDIVTV